MWFSQFINTDIGNSMVITNVVIGIAYIVIAIAIRFTNVVRLEYRTPFSVCMLGISMQNMVAIFNVAPLLTTSLNTFVTMITVVLAAVLFRDSSIR